jgi:large repetitive protein
VGSTRSRRRRWAVVLACATALAVPALSWAPAGADEPQPADPSDLVIQKTTTTPSVVTGGDITFKFTVGTLGPDPSPATVTDPLPTGFTLVFAGGTGWTCAGTQTITCTHAANLNPGDPADTNLQIIATAGAAAAPSGINSTVLNTATVSGPNADPNSGNNSSTASFTVIPITDLTLSKTHAGSFAVGGTANWTVTVHNNGPGFAAPVTAVKDTLPAGFAVIPTNGNGWACSFDQGTQSVICIHSAALPVGDSSFTVSALVTPAAAPNGTSVQVTNSVTLDNATNDTNPNNNSASDTPATVTTSADLQVTKTHSGNFSPGQQSFSTVTVTNNGPAVAAGPLQLTDNIAIPAGMTINYDGPGSGGTGWSCNPGTVTLNGPINVTLVNVCSHVGTLAPGASTSVSLAFTPGSASAPNGPVTFTNTATVTSPTSDPDPANNSSTDPTVVSRKADLSITKTPNATFTAGGTGSYKLDVANSGLYDENGTVTVTDTLPPNQSYVSSTGSAAGWSCSAAAQQVTCTRTGLASGATSSIILHVNVAPAAAPAGLPTTQNDLATVSGSATEDTAPGNNSTQLAVTVQPQPADLAVTKTNPGGLTAGTTGTYTITVTNNGPGVAGGPITVTDALPAGLSFQPLGSSQACSAVAAVVTCTTAGPLASGGSVPFTVAVDVAASVPAGAQRANTAQVTGPTTDPSAGNNSSTATTAVTTSADLAVAKSAPATVTAGTNLTYAITVTNNGPSDAQAVAVTDTVPANTTFVSATPSAGSCSGTATVTCTIPTLASGASVSISLVVSVGSGVSSGTSITNTATADGTTPDPNDANDSATAGTTVTTATDLAVSKTAPATAIAGTDLGYTVNVTNNGPSIAQGVSLVDPLPAGTTLVSATPSAGSCSGTSTVTCTIGTVASGATVTVAVVTLVSTAVANGTVLTNTATGTASTADPDAANNAATANTTVTTSADVSVKKTGPTTVTAGNDLTYSISATNHGPSDAQAVTVTDVLPSSTTFVSATPSAGSCVGTSTVTCALGTLADGASATVTLVVHVDVGTPGGTVLTNTAEVGSPEEAEVSVATADPASSNNASTVATLVLAAPAPNAASSVTAANATTIGVVVVVVSVPRFTG